MKFNSNLSVAYSQIYIEDYSCGFHVHDKTWNDEEMSSMLCVGRNFIIIGTVRSIQVPFFIEILEFEPQLDLNQWDHVNECTIQIGLGVLVSGDFDTEGEMLKIDLTQGIYEVRVCYRGLGTISWDGLEGEDSYHVYMWPASNLIPKSVLKQWKL